MAIKVSCTLFCCLELLTNLPSLYLTELLTMARVRLSRSGSGSGAPVAAHMQRQITAGLAGMCTHCTNMLMP